MTAGGIEMVVPGRTAALTEEFQVRRILPWRRRRMVGPFIFLDEMGPADLPAGRGLDVPPHPHIGLATVTWLFAGELIHRDSLGFTQRIRPGDVNWMTAGSGIVHSERSPAEARLKPSRLHGIQSWVALPTESEDAGPEFRHYPAADLPRFDHGGFGVQVIAGTFLGRTSPVTTASPTLYAILRTAGRDAAVRIDPDSGERGVYLCSGRARLGDRALEPGSMAVLAPGDPVPMAAKSGSLALVLGGEPVGERHIWWNFVSSSRDRIERARADWQDQRFGPVPGETEFVPLPG